MRYVKFAASVLCALLCLQGCSRYADTNVSAALPVIMYHSVLKDPSRTGKYVVTPDTLESDLIYLSEHGYVTVTAADAIAFVQGGRPLPDRPVMLTFDDGYYNNLVYVLPLLEKYDMKAVIAVVGDYTQRFSDTPDPNPNYAHLSWEDIAALCESGRVEIQNHSWDMHTEGARRGCMRKRSESLSDYRRALYGDVTRLNDALRENCGITCSTFVYPYGQISPESRDILKEAGFLATLSCYEQISVLTQYEPDTLFSIGRFNRPGNLGTGEFMKRLFGDEGLKNP